MNDSGNTIERIGEIAPGKILDDDDLDLVTVLGVYRPQYVGLARTCDPSYTFSSRICGNFCISSPSNTVAFFQEAYQNMRSGVSGNTGKLCDEHEESGEMM